MIDDVKAGLELAKDIVPLAKLGDYLRNRALRREKMKQFCNEFLRHRADETDFMEYYSWTQEAREWYCGDGDIRAMSVRETKVWWSDPNLYATYDAALRKFVLQGGSVRRIMIVEKEFWDLNAQLVFLRTGFRHFKLGMEPLVVYRPDTWTIVRDLGVDCDMFGSVNNRVAYFVRFEPEILCVKSHSKPFVEKASATFRSLESIAKPFEEWRSTVSWGSRLNVIAEAVEAEAALIDEYARGTV